MRVRACCFCIQLKLASGILGGFDILVGLMNISSYTRNYFIQVKYSPTEDALTGAVLVISGAVLLIGTMLDSRMLVFCWLCFHFSVLFVDLFLLLTAVGTQMSYAMYGVFENLMNVLMYATYVGIYGYFIVVVWSYYRLLDDDDECDVECTD